MTPTELIAEVRSRGGQITADGADLRLTGRVGSITEQLRDMIRDQKEGVIRELRQEEAEMPLILPKDGSLPVSSFQERLWVIQKLDPKATEYNLVTLWPYEDRFTADALDAALRLVVRRHSILRTCFREAPTGPVAIVLEPDQVTIDHVDLDDLDESKRRAAAEELIRRETSRPFDLENGPPCRFSILNFGQDGVALLVSVHHIAIDHWSLRVLRDEIEAAAADSQQFALRAPGLEYADFAAWQNRRFHPSKLINHLDWWEETLNGHPDLCAFNADLVPNIAWEGKACTFTWDSEFSHRLTEFAQSRNTTLYACLLAAASVALHRETGLEDIVIGSPSAQRERPEFETIIGPFVNTQVLRFSLTPETAFSELLVHTQQTLMDFHPHSHVPFELVVERAQPARNLNRSPLFQLAVVLQNAAGAPTELVFGGGAVHDMTWFVREVGDQVTSTIEYRSDIYLRDTVERLHTRLETILRHAIEHPETAVADIPLLSESEREQITSEFVPNPVEVDLTPYPMQVARIASQLPENTAVRHNGQTLSYRELDARANQMARFLAGNNISRGSVVGLCLDRTPELILAMVAIHRSGAAYVPLDPEFPRDRLQYILSDSGADAVITGESAALGLSVPDQITEFGIGTVMSKATALPAEEFTVDIAPEDSSHIIYTSGSTGKPKGVEISHGAVSNLLGALRLELGLIEADVFAATTTVSFDIAAVELQLPLTIGATIELLGRDIATNGEALADALASCGATVSQATPSAWRLLLEAGWSGNPNLLAISGGEALTRDLADDLLARVGRLWNGYGPSETTIYSTGTWVASDGKPISIGRPVANTRVYLLDPSGNLVPIGMQGEICIGGDGVAKGYVGLPDQTQERFRVDPFDPTGNGRIYHTGDIGRWSADGTLFHLGRSDHQVKIRGVRIELGEIEATLLSSDQIRQAVVLVDNDGQAGQRLAAYVVYEPGEEMTASEVRRYLRTSLPRHMVPAIIMDLPKLPQTPNGKLDRKALPKLFGRSGPKQVASSPPKPGLESSIADIWREILNVETVGADDNFFDIGGHSLLTLRVVQQVEAKLGVTLDPRLLFFKSLRQITAEVSNRRH